MSCISIIVVRHQPLTINKYDTRREGPQPYAWRSPSYRLNFGETTDIITCMRMKSNRGGWYKTPLRILRSPPIYKMIRYPCMILLFPLDITIHHACSKAINYRLCLRGAAEEQSSSTTSRCFNESVNSASLFFFFFFGPQHHRRII